MTPPICQKCVEEIGVPTTMTAITIECDEGEATIWFCRKHPPFIEDWGE